MARFFLNTTTGETKSVEGTPDFNTLNNAGFNEVSKTQFERERIKTKIVPKREKIAVSGQTTDPTQRRTFFQGKKPLSIDVTKPIPTNILTTDKSKTAEQIRKTAKQRDVLIQNISNTITTRPRAIANESFVQAVSQAKLGHPATADKLKRLVGASVQDVVNRFGLDVGDAGMLEIPEGKEKIPSEAEVGGFTDIVRVGEIGQPGSFLAGRRKTQQEIDTETGVQVQRAEQIKKSFAEQLKQNLLAQLPEQADVIESAVTDTTTPSGVLPKQITTPSVPSVEAPQFSSIAEQIRNLTGVKSEAFATAAKEQGLDALNQNLTNIQNEIQGTRERFDAEEEAIRNQTIPQTQIDRQLSQLASQKNKELADLEIRQSIAVGSFDRARSIAKEASVDAFESAKLEIEALQTQGAIDRDQRDAAFKQLEFERDLIESGWIPLSDEESALIPESQFIEDNDGNKFLKPEAGTALDQEAIDNWAINILDEVASFGSVPDELKTEVNNRISQLINGGFVALTPAQKKNLNEVSDDLRGSKQYKDMLDIQNGFLSVTSGLSLETGFGDLAAINGFQRMIDPGAVVREGEFKTVAEAQGFLQQTIGLAKKFIEGDKLTSQGREQMLEASNALFREKANNFNNTVGEQFERRAELLGLSPDMINAKFNVPTETQVTLESIFTPEVAEVVQGETLDESDIQTLTDIFK